MKCFALYLEPDRCSGNISFIIFIIFISIITISSIYCYVTNCLSTTIHSLMNLQFGQGSAVYSETPGMAEMGLEDLLPRWHTSVTGKLVLDLDGCSPGGLNSSLCRCLWAAVLSPSQHDS